MSWTPDVILPASPLATPGAIQSVSLAASTAISRWSPGLDAAPDSSLTYTFFDDPTSPVVALTSMQGTYTPGDSAVLPIGSGTTRINLAWWGSLPSSVQANALTHEDAWIWGAGAQTDFRVGGLTLSNLWTTQLIGSSSSAPLISSGALGPWGGFLPTTDGSHVSNTILTENTYDIPSVLRPVDFALLAVAGAPVTIPVFNSVFYLSHNPDVSAVLASTPPQSLSLAAWNHYNTFGWHENRDPSATFNTAGYLLTNPDVAASGMNPLTHFDLYGYAEGRES